MTSHRRELVLVTGGSGLVGSCLADELQRNGDKLGREFVFLSSRDGDLASQTAVRRLFDNYKPTYVIHLAAKVGGLYAHLQDKEIGEFYSANESMNRNVLALSGEFKVKRCVSCLSTCVFPKDSHRPVEESLVSFHRGGRDFLKTSASRSLTSSCSSTQACRMSRTRAMRGPSDTSTT
jgi:GDP-L-fucose synthase